MRNFTNFFGIVYITALISFTCPLFAQQPNQASDFEVELNRTGNGVIIKKYIGVINEVVIPEKIEGIPVAEIYGSTDFRFNRYDGAFLNSNVTSVVFPNTKITIGPNAFRGSKVTSITLHITIEDIGDNAFADCLQLENVIINMNLRESSRQDSGGGYIRNRFASEIFSNCRKLKTVNLPTSMTNIPNGMFSGCSSLSTITIPSSVKYIGSDAFRNCALASLELPENVETIGKNAFDNNNLTTLKLSRQIRTIAVSAFANNSLTEVIIPNGIGRINFETVFGMKGGMPGNVSLAFLNNNLTLGNRAELIKLGYPSDEF